MARGIVLLCTLVLMAGGRAAAQSADDFTGTWAFQVEGRNFAVLALEMGPEGLQGTIELAGNITVAQAPSGLVIRDVRGPPSASAVKAAERGATLAGAERALAEFPALRAKHLERIVAIDGDLRAFVQIT